MNQGPLSAAETDSDSGLSLEQRDSQTSITTWTAIGRSIPKPNNDYFEVDGRTLWRQNEDCFRITETADTLVAAVADGAGGSGLFCGAWAQTLVKNLPAFPIHGLGSLNEWINGFWADFRAEFKTRTAADPAKHSKFVQEGSFSTLTACWLRRGLQGLFVHWLGYGDSPFLLFDRTEGGARLIRHHPPTLSALDQAPHLLNWKDMPNRESLVTGCAVLPPQATLLLASDGVGQSLLLHYLADLYHRCEKGAAYASMNLMSEFQGLLKEGYDSRLADRARAHLARREHDFTEELGILWDSLKTEQDFSALVRECYRMGLLPNDDSTLIMIDISTSTIPIIDEPNLKRV